MENLTSVIVPTYNEAHNLPTLVQRIDRAMRQERLNYECIVVDDNSPDGTYRTARELAADFPVRAYLRTKERGLSSAMLYGFQQASGEVVGWIDADLQHPPEIIPRLVATIVKDGYAMAVASRIVSGGRVKDWPWHRQFTSLCGRILVLPLTQVRDTMSGFFFIRPQIIEGLELIAIGYKLGLEIMVKGKHRGRIKEIPYTFCHRSVGESKMTWRTHVAYLYQVLLLYGYKFSLY